VLVFLVILAGAVVRTTGSGMGCPDWPKCFGQYIPPTDISELPADYKVRFLVKGKEIADFDAFKTWTEYVNRLLGALLGVVIFALCVSSISYRKADPLKIVLSVLLLLVTGFVGWLGSVVVKTDLEPVKITIHMLTAFIILALAVVTFHRANSQTRMVNTFAQVLPKWVLPLLVGAVFLTLLQVMLGTQVREEIDVIAKTLEYRWRELWVQQLSSMFIVHRSASWLVVLVNAGLVWYLFKQATPEHKILRRSLVIVMVGIFIEIALGITLAYFAMPKVVQPAHLLIASTIFAAQIFAALEYWTIRKHALNAA
jgi:cytochrome c oxidase assembly protein subunit 15